MLTWEELIERQKEHRIVFSHFLVTLGYATDEDPHRWGYEGTDLDEKAVEVLQRLAKGSQEYKETKFFQLLHEDKYDENTKTDYVSFVQEVAQKLLEK